VDNSKTYRIDRTRIVFEQFEDETVLVNTETGYYYSLSPSGSDILRLLEEGCPAGDLIHALFGNSKETGDTYRELCPAAYNRKYNR